MMDLYSKHSTPESLYGYDQLEKKYSKPTMDMCNHMMKVNYRNLAFNEFPYNFVKELPDGLSVEWLLSLKDTLITQLPNNLTVRGSMNIENTPISHLPEYLTIGQELYLHDTPMLDKESLPWNTMTVGGHIHGVPEEIARLHSNFGFRFDDE
jgi:hypothetical protein